MTDLRECPFCGGEAILIEGDESAYVQCLDVSCHIGPFFDGDNDASNCAIAEWNRRSPVARNAALEEAARVADELFYPDETKISARIRDAIRAMKHEDSK